MARYESTDGTAWYLTDNLGTVRDIVDADGDLLNHIDYDSFGQIIAQSNAAAGDRFTYTGREWDSEIGLYYYRARYYDPQLGKFISVDPIGFAAGDANLYRYVANMPLGATDPSGMTAISDYAIKLGSGPVGVLIGSARFQCMMGAVFGWAVTDMVVGNGSSNKRELVSLAIEVTSCATFPAAIRAQLGFVMVAEALHLAYLYNSGEISGVDVAAAVLQHSIGFAVGRGLSRHSATAKTSVRIDAPVKIGAKTWQDYEAGIRKLYGESSFSSRQYKTIVDGKIVNGVADNVATIGGKNVAVEAKFVDDWARSLRNPASPIGNKPFAVAEQAKMLEQARKYSAAFDDVIYHSNSPELIAYYTKVFQDAGVTNFRFTLTQ